MNKRNGSHLAIIPARGGSKRLPGKNITKLNGKPLISYTIEAAIQSGCFDKILFSSDDDDILKAAGAYPELSIEKRPAHLAGDTVKVINLVREVINREAHRDHFQTATLLLPTCPFRKASDIQKGFDLLDEDTHSVVSVTTFEFPIRMSMELDDDTHDIGYIFQPSPLVTDDTRSQDHKPAYRPNGAFYMSWLNHLIANGNYFKGKVKGYPMSRDHSVDIDEKQDLVIAQFMLEKQIIQLDY